MICPSCNAGLEGSFVHCTRCGIALTPLYFKLAQIKDNLAWILRRSLGGLVAGALGGVLAIALARLLYFGRGEALGFGNALDFFPGTMILPALLCGCFIGVSSGISERSSYKTTLGGLLGALGALLGAVLYPQWMRVIGSGSYAYSLALALSWAVAGAFAGLSSGILEASKRKVLAGTLGGFLGGLLGGGVASQLYGALLMNIGSLLETSWTVGRLVEAAAGGVLGLHIWLGIGLAEKLYIFKRRRLTLGENKTCDDCGAENPLRAWYCAQCGSVLQVAALREQLRPTPYEGLEKIRDALLFFSGLSKSASVILSFSVFIVFLLENILFALFGSFLVGMLLYLVASFFQALSDWISGWMVLVRETKS